MGCGQKKTFNVPVSLAPVRAEGHLPRVSRQSPRSLIINHMYSTLELITVKTGFKLWLLTYFIHCHLFNNIFQTSLMVITLSHPYYKLNDFLMQIYPFKLIFVFISPI